MEKDIERSARLALKKLGFLCLKQTCEKGIPDRLIVGPNSVICFCEFKYDKNKLSKNQKHYKRKLEKLGFTVLVAYDKQTVIDWAKTQIKEIPKTRKTLHSKS